MGVYNKEAYKVWVFTKIFMIALVVGAINTVYFFEDAKSEYINEKEHIVLNEIN